MPSYEFIYFVWSLIQIGVELAVMFVCFPLWRKRRLRFALLFAWAALVGLAQILLDYFSLRYPVSAATSKFTWSAVQIAGIISMSLYATAVVLLVRHFQAMAYLSSPPTRTEDQPLA